MNQKKSIIFFLIGTTLLSTLCYFFIILNKNTQDFLIPVLMWVPGIMAFIVQNRFYKGERILGLNKCGISFIVVALVLPLLYLTVSYGLYWILNSNSFYFYADALSPFATILGLISALLLALGEEIGWRGFLLPKLTNIFNAKKAILIGGLIWALWHFPLIIAGLYKPGTPNWYKLPMFTVEILAITAILTLLRFKSNSVWPAAVFHASHNYFDQSVFESFTAGPNTTYFTGETGIITAVSMIILVFILFKIYGPIDSEKKLS